MIKDRLTEAIEANLENIKKGDDHIPIGMRGELEVIVKDRNGNVKSYERDHNQVTKLAKMALLHLLAGEIGTVDTDPYSVVEENATGMRAYALDDSTGTLPTAKARIANCFVSGNHTTTTNTDGQMVSGEPFFFSGTDIQNDTSKSTHLSQVAPFSESFTGNQKINFNFPTKMLFGTGLEDHSVDTIPTTYSNDFGTALSPQAILVLNGYAAGFEGGAINSKFFYGCSSAVDEDESLGNYDISQNKRLSNWYSANAYRCRTLQPASTRPITQTNPTSDDTALKGAIKNCFIETTGDTSLYNPTTKMAQAPYRGYGHPCFIYAKRSTQGFYTTEDNKEVYYSLNDALGASAYETEVTYTVVMPAQPVASDSISTYYPYNGWVLRQAGLFCDSRYKIRTVADDDSTLGESKFLADVNSGIESTSEGAHTWRDSVGGQLLFTRNLSSPFIKTADDEVTFIWHIFITV